MLLAISFCHCARFLRVCAHSGMSPPSMFRERTHHDVVWAFWHVTGLCVHSCACEVTGVLVPAHLGCSLVSSCSTMWFAWGWLIRCSLNPKALTFDPAVRCWDVRATNNFEYRSSTLRYRCLESYIHRKTTKTMLDSV